MDNASQSRRRVLALFLPVAAVLYIAAEAVSPKGTDKVVTDTAAALNLLAIAAKHPAQVYAAGTFAVPRARSAGRLVRGDRHAGQGPRLGRGYRRGADRRNRRLLRSDRQRRGLRRPRSRGDGPPGAGRSRRVPGQDFQLRVRLRVHGRLLHRHLRGPGIMGFALWRSRAVPRWLAVLFFVGLELAQQQISSGAVVIVYMLPFAAAMVLLAARIWQAASLPASQPQPDPGGVPV